MARKVKFTREEIIDAGFNCIRKNGREGFSARSVGAELGASSMVIFSHFKTIDELFQEVYQKAYNFYIDLIFNESFNEKRYKYKTMALTYLKFAQEEKNLFKILFMEKRDVEYERLPESKLNSLYDDVKEENNLTDDDISDIRYKYWIFTHGIAVLLITTFMKPDMKYIEKALTENFENLVRTKKFEKEFL